MSQTTDGWHVYHRCGGTLRQLQVISKNGRPAGSLCVVCGEWAELNVGPTTPIELPKEDPEHTGWSGEPHPGRHF